MIFFCISEIRFHRVLKKMSLLNHRINVNVIAKERKSEKSSSRRLRISQQQHDDVHKHNSQIHQRNFSWWLSKIFDDFLDAVTNELNVTFHSIFGCCISCYPLLNVIVAFMFLRKINKILLLPVRIDQWDFFFIQFEKHFSPALTSFPVTLIINTWYFIKNKSNSILKTKIKLVTSKRYFINTSWGVEWIQRGRKIWKFKFLNDVEINQK